MPTEIDGEMCYTIREIADKEGLSRQTVWHRFKKIKADPDALIIYAKKASCSSSKMTWMIPDNTIGSLLRGGLREKRKNSRGRKSNAGIEAKGRFGLLIYRARTAQGMTLRQLAEKSGVDYTYISKLENEKVSPPRQKTRDRLLNALGLEGSALEEQTLSLEGLSMMVRMLVENVEEVRRAITHIEKSLCRDA